MNQEQSQSVVEESTAPFVVDPNFPFKPHPFAAFTQAHVGYAEVNNEYQLDALGNKTFKPIYYGENLYLSPYNPLVYDFNILLDREGIQPAQLDNPFDVAYQTGKYKAWIESALSSRDIYILNALSELKAAYFQLGVPTDSPQNVIRLENNDSTYHINVPIIDEFVRKSLAQMYKRRKANQFANTIQGLFQYRLTSKSGSFIMMDLQPGQTTIEVTGKNNEVIHFSIEDILAGRTFMQLDRFSGVTDIEGNPLFEGDQVQTLQSESSYGTSTGAIQFNPQDGCFYFFREMEEAVRLEADMLIVKKS